MNNLSKENTTAKNFDGPHPNSPLRYLTATSMMANKVFNNEGEKLGDIKDFMVDIRSGKIEYWVIEFGGFLGIGEKFFAVPFALLRIDTKNESWLFDQPRSALEKAPGFDQSHWPKTNSHEFDSMNSYWGDFMGPNVGIH